MINRIPELNGIRGLAIILVLLFNGIASFYKPNERSPEFLRLADHAFEIGWTGVTLFFVLSGFLIGRILTTNRESENYFSAFFARRAFRILPLYLVFISPLFAIPLLNVDESLPALAEHLSTGETHPALYIVFMQNIQLALQGHWGSRWIDTTWSLAVEEQFYILAALAIRWIKPSRLYITLVCVALSAPIIRIILIAALEPHHAGVACYTLLPTRWDALALGILAALAYENRDRKAAATFRILTNPIVFGFLIILSAIVSWVSPSAESLIMTSVGYSIIALLFAAVLFHSIDNGRGTRTLFRNPILGWIGTISYGIYLIHEPVISVTFKFIFNQTRTIATPFDLAILGIAILITISMAAISWYVFEKPLVRVGKRFRYSNASSRKRSDSHPS